jgi:hypothetical protein
MEEEIIDKICKCNHPGTAHIKYGYGKCQREGCECLIFEIKNA